MAAQPEAVGGRFSKVLVAVAAEQVMMVKGTKTVPAIGRIRLHIIPNRTAAVLEEFVCQSIEPGSLVVIDDLRSYNKLPEKGYPHQVDKRPKLRPHQNLHNQPLPKAHLVIALLKRWLIGTHQGRGEADYLQQS